MDMKKFLTFLLIFFMGIKVYADGGVTVSKNSITVDEGKTATVTIKATNAAGIVEISSLDTSIATVDKSSFFFDTSLGSSSVNITITGKKEGTVTIRVNLKDIATFDEIELKGNKDITVTVKKPVIANNTKTSSSSKQDDTNKTNNKNNTSTSSKSENKETTKNVPKKEMVINRFEIVGYDINFNKEMNEYSINIDKNVNKLYIIVDGEDLTVIGDKEVDIKDKEYIIVSVSNKDEQIHYKININRIEEKIIEKEVIKENDIENKIILYSMIFFEVLSIILLMCLLRNKFKQIKKYK